MRVVLVLNSLGAGGTERSTALALPGLRAEGIEPLVVCLLHRDEGDERRVRDEGTEVVVLGSAGVAGQVRELRALLRERRPALVHTAIFEADLVGRLAAAGTGVPVLSSLVNTPYVPARFSDPRVTRWRLRVVQAVDAVGAALLTDHLHAVTSGVAADAQRHLRVAPRRITVVERGRPWPAAAVGPDRDAVRRSLGVDGDAPVVLTVGRVEYQKGHVHLVEAAARLRVHRPDLTVLVAGRPGNASDDLVAAVARHGVGDNVRVLGHRDDVGDLLAAADVFALPSVYEGTAGAAVEALAAGVPVVASRLAGTEGLLVDGVHARLVPPADPVALAGAIDDALADAGGRNASMVAAGRRLARERFDLDRSVRRMAALYRRVAVGVDR